MTAPKIINSIVAKGLLLKLYLIRSYSHIQVPIQVINYVTLISVWLKLYGYGSWRLTVFLTAVMLLVLIVVGWLDVKYNIMKSEMSLINQHNPEMQELMRRKQ